MNQDFLEIDKQQRGMSRFEPPDRLKRPRARLPVYIRAADTPRCPPRPARSSVPKRTDDCPRAARETRVIGPRPLSWGFSGVCRTGARDNTSMSVTGGYATMSRFGGGLTAVPGTSTLDPHERARLTHRAMAVDTSHLPNDCGPMSAFGKQLESTKKNEPSFFFGRTTRAERARACNFDERSMKEALQIIEAGSPCPIKSGDLYSLGGLLSAAHVYRCRLRQSCRAPSGPHRRADLSSFEPDPTGLPSHSFAEVAPSRARVSHSWAQPSPNPTPLRRG